MGGVSYRKEIWTVKDRRDWWEQYCAMVNADFHNAENACLAGANSSRYTGSGFTGSRGFAGSAYLNSSGRGPGAGLGVGIGSRVLSSGTAFAGSAYLNGGSGRMWTGSGYNGSYLYGSGWLGSGTQHELTGRYSFGSGRTAAINANAEICALGYGMQLI